MRAGMGIAGCLVNVARHATEIVRVLEKPCTLHRQMWLAMHRDAKATRRIRLLFDHLAIGLTAFVRDENWW